MAGETLKILFYIAFWLYALFGFRVFSIYYVEGKSKEEQRIPARFSFASALLTIWINRHNEHTRTSRVAIFERRTK